MWQGLECYLLEQGIDVVNSICLHDKVTCQVVEGKALHLGFFYFGKILVCLSEYLSGSND